MTTTNIGLTVGQLASFDQDGYVILPGILEAEVLEKAIGAVEELVDEVARQRAAEGKSALCSEALFETRYGEIFKDHPGDVPFGFRPELHRAGFFDLLFHPIVLNAAEQLLGPEVRLYPNYTVRPKLPDHAGTLVPWHQDSGFTEARHQGNKNAGHVDTMRMVNLWTPFVPATKENGCMQFVPGSHRQGTGVPPEL